MLLVFLSHFVETYFQSALGRTHTFRIITRIASPAFVWISGVTLAVLRESGGRWLERTRDRLIDRAIFLVLVCHPVMVGAYLLKAGSWQDGVRIMFITDTIALCLFVGVFVISKLGSWRRAAIGLALMLGAWTLTAAWNPGIGSLSWKVKDVLLGDWRDHWPSYHFPQIPWMGFYLIASAAGTWFVRSQRAGLHRQIRWLSAAFGVTAILAAQLVGMAGRAAAHLPMLHGYATPISILASAMKLPPTPVYFLQYGGLALVLFSLVLAAYDTGYGQSLVRWTEVFGRCSVVTFVVQYYVYYGLLEELPRPPERWAPAYFVATVVLIWGVVAGWERLDGNRLITVGYPGIVAWFRTRRVESGASRPLSGGVAPDA